MIEDFHNTFNARHLNPKEVAETFIWSNNYEKLIQNNHSVILGARGCGKTTLMKMLTLPALYSWKDKRAKEIRNKMPFYGIYISTDIYWDVKNQTYSSQLIPFGTFSEKISKFSVNNNVFTSLCDTFIDIIEVELKTKNEEQEFELCNELIKAWKLSSVIPKLKYIKEALNKRIDEVNQLIQDVILNNNITAANKKQDYFNLSFETSIEYIIPLFERIYNLKGEKKWALCFDELEFAPNWLQTTLFKSLRSRKQYILYKLSASPILSLELEKSLKGEYPATSGNDLQIIKMWNSSENEEFSKKIIADCLYRKYEIKDSKSFFGSNEIYNKSRNSYEEGSEFYNEMIELLAKDNSFKAFLGDNGINISKPIPKNKSQKDTLFRKIKPIVYYRNYYLEADKINEKKEQKTKRRKRKINALYSGIEVLSKICDGNPRWLIGIINSILAKASTVRATEEIQNEELLNASKRFRNVIANIPIGINNQLTIIDIIDKIGNYFKDQVLGKNFIMDPQGSFTVDSNKKHISDEIITLLEKCISQGAIILLDATDDSFDFEIRNQKFKLSYLFFIQYKLPLRTYNEVKLSKCLLTKSDKDHSSQISLF